MLPWPVQNGTAPGTARGEDRFVHVVVYEFMGSMCGHWVFNVTSWCSEGSDVCSFGIIGCRDLNSGI